MKKLFLLLLLLVGLDPLPAQEPLSPRAENRFLFVVETSTAMTRFSKTARETVASLIESGAQGQIRPDDTFGLWTFHEKLDATFPMQRWSAAENKNLAAAAADFLKKARPGRKSDFRAVLSPLDSVVKSSRALTVILISAGGQPIQGTPFDSEINAIYLVYARQFRNAKTPFVTILVARNGKWATYSVNSSRGPLQIPNPPLPSLPTTVEMKTNAPPVKTNLVPVTTVKRFAKENIIMTKPVVTNPPATNLDVITNLATKAVPEKTNQLATSASTNVVQTPTTNFQSVAPSPGSKTSAPVSVEVAATRSDGAKHFEPNKIELENVNQPSPKTRFSPNSSKHTAPLGVTQNAIGLSPTSTPAISPLPVVAAQSASASRKFFLAGAALLLFAGILVFFIIRSSRKSDASLISRSMNQRPK